MHYMCILFSNQLNKFYLGSTSQTPQVRLLKHLANHIDFTAKAKDWKIVHFAPFNSTQEAKQREAQLKRWKNSQRIQALIGRSATE